MGEPVIKPFDWEDPFALDEQLSDEERMVRDTAENYARRTPAACHKGRISTRISTARSCEKWAHWGYSVRRFLLNMAAPASAT